MAPGLANTDVLETVPERVEEKVLLRIPLARFASPEELEVLSHRRRRYLLYCLQEYTPPLSLANIADQITTWEETDGDDGDADAYLGRRLRVYNALYHDHVPALEDAGIVDYHQREDAVDVGPAAEELKRWVARNYQAEILRDTRGVIAGDKTRIRAFAEIRRLTRALDLARSDREPACQLFRTAQDRGMLQGRGIDMIATACVYAICRINEHPRSFEEVAAVAGISQQKVRTGYSVLNRKLALPIPPATPQQYLPHIAPTVGAKRNTERRARELLEKADRFTSDAANPMGAAAGALYLAGRETDQFLSQTEVAEAASVSTVTIRKRVRELEAAVVL